MIDLKMNKQTGHEARVQQHPVWYASGAATTQPEVIQRIRENGVATKARSRAGWGRGVGGPGLFVHYLCSEHTHPTPNSTPTLIPKTTHAHTYTEKRRQQTCATPSMEGWPKWYALRMMPMLSMPAQFACQQRQATNTRGEQ
jgi:hypothetical protein